MQYNTRMTQRQARTDSHRPAALVTEDYQYVLSFDFQEPQPVIVGPNANGQYFTIPVPAAERAARERILGLLSASSEHRENGACDHCGARIRYTAILRYGPTGGHVSVGEQCLDNRFSKATDEFQALRKQAGLDRQQQRIKKLVAQFCLDNPDLSWMASLEESWAAVGIGQTVGSDRTFPRVNYFVLDVSHKLRKYGELSPKQVDAVRASLAKDAELIARSAARDAERAAAEAEREPRQSVPSGRQIVTGVVVALKEVIDRFAFGSRYSRNAPTTWRMIVEDDRGFRVYGSIPSSLLTYTSESGAECYHSYESLKGARVSFTAELEPSRGGSYRDPARR